VLFLTSFKHVRLLLLFVEVEFAYK